MAHWASVEPMAIKEWITVMHQKKLSPATVHQAFRVLREALNQAVIWNLIPRSPASLVKAPRVPAKEMKVWDEEQIHLFLAQAKRSSRYYALYLLGYPNTQGMAEAIRAKRQPSGSRD